MPDYTDRVTLANCFITLLMSIHYFFFFHCRPERDSLLGAGVEQWDWPGSEHKSQDSSSLQGSTGGGILYLSLSLSLFLSVFFPLSLSLSLVLWSEDKLVDQFQEGIVYGVIVYGLPISMLLWLNLNILRLIRKDEVRVVNFLPAHTVTKFWNRW